MTCNSAAALLCFTMLMAAPQAPHPAQGDSIDNPIRISVERVQIDAVASDRKGRLVTDLRPEEIEIRQDGKIQKVTSFTLVRAGQTTAGRQNGPGGLRRSEVNRVIALIVDDLGLSFDSVDYVKESLKGFVNKQMMAGDLVSVVRTSGGAGALQQFTTDKRLLLSAIDAIRFNFFSRTELNSVIWNGGTAGAPDLAQRAERRGREFQQNFFTVGTLGAVNYVVAGMRNLPGRKSAVLFSQSMPLLRSDWSSSRVTDELFRLSDLATRAGVVLYTIDPRGTPVLGYAAAMSGLGQFRGPMSRESMFFHDLRNDYIESQGGLAMLASETGGLFFSGSNDIAGLMARASEDMSAYYLIGYRPETGTFDDSLKSQKYHRIQMKALRNGVKIRHRQGFLGTPDQDGGGTNKSKEQAIAEALASPFLSGDIRLALTCWFDRGTTQPGVVHSMIHIDGAGIGFAADADGQQRAEIDIVTSTFGDAGKLSEITQRSIRIRVRQADLETVRKQGLLYSVAHPVAKSGAFIFRAIVRDSGSGKLGSANQFIEVPDVGAGRLALSGILLASAGYSQGGEAAAEDVEKQDYSLGHPAIRRFSQGQRVNYGYRVINPAAHRETGQCELETSMSIYRGAERVFAAPARPLTAPGQGRGWLRIAGALQLTPLFTPGEYTLQVAVRDRLAKDGRNVVTQFMNFEVLGPEGAAENASARE